MAAAGLDLAVADGPGLAVIEVPAAVATQATDVSGTLVQSVCVAAVARACATHKRTHITHSLFFFVIFTGVPPHCLGRLDNLFLSVCFSEYVTEF